MARNYSNIALDTTLTAGIAAGDLSCVVASAAGWPAAPFAAVLDPGLVTEEVVQVTNKVGTTFTITRGFDGTTASAHALGATVRHSAIAGDFTDLQAADTSEASTRATADTTNAGNLTTHAALTTSAHGGIVASTDPRLTDSRTPTAHASTHASIGTDPVTLAESQVTNLTSDLALKAPLASPALTGVPTVPTAAPGTNTTQAASTAFVTTAVASASVADGDKGDVAVSGSGTVWTVDALPESRITNLVADLALKAPIASPTFTGTPAAPTAAPGTNTTQLATTAFAAAANALDLKIASNLSDVANVTTARGNLGAAPLSATYITQTANSELSAEQALGSLASGYLKNTTTTGVLSVQATPIPSADLGSGSPSATTFLRGDQTWATPSGGGTIDGSGAAGQVTTWLDSDTITGSAGLLYDDASKRLSVVNSAGSAELRVTGAAGSQSLLTFYADGAEKWEFFRQGTTHGFGIYDATNGVISMEIDPAAKNMSLHNVSGVGYVLALGATGSVNRRATLNTTASAAMYEHNAIASTGTPADGFGGAWEYNMQDDSSTNVAAMEFNLRWSTAAHGTRKAQAKWYILDTDYREALRIEASGSAPMIGFLGANAQIRQSIASDATDLATAITLVNDLKAKLQGFGLLT